MASASFSLPVCIFGDGKPTTVEDVFPRWIRKYLPPKPRTRRHSADLLAGTYRGSFKAYPYTANAKIICQACNNEFVSRFDSEASPILKAMLASNLALELDAITRHKLARWAFKQLILAPFVMPGAGFVIAPHVYTEFRHSGEPPANRTVLYLGNYRVGLNSSRVHFHKFDLVSDEGNPLPNEPHSYGITFCIKNLVVHGFFNDRVGSGLPPLPAQLASLVLPLWPGQGGLRWPPAQLLDDVTLPALGGRFADLSS